MTELFLSPPFRLIYGLEYTNCIPVDIVTARFISFSGLFFLQSDSAKFAIIAIGHNRNTIIFASDFK